MVKEYQARNEFLHKELNNINGFNYKNQMVLFTFVDVNGVIKKIEGK